MVMMDSLFKLFFASFFFTAVWAGFDPNVCTPITQSCGPIPPPLPVNFELKGEYVDKLNNTRGFMEMYYDFDNLRAKFVLLSSGIELHLLFDYNVSQILEYYIMHPGSTVEEDPLSFECKAAEMEYSEHRSIFGYRYGLHGSRSAMMYDSIHVLRFGGPYQYAYNGSSGGDDSTDSDSSSDDPDERGLIWNAFIGCIYEKETEFTALIRYKFSGDRVVTAGGNVVGDIDGSGRYGPLSVPIAVDYFGTGARFDYDTGNRSPTEYNVSQSFSWFKADPIFDNKNFQIPPYMYCDKYQGWKSMPQFPMAFSVRMETIGFSQDMFGKMTTAELVSVDQLYYYNEKGLARRDYTPHREMDTEIYSKFGNTGPVKTIYDYVTLQLYVINKATGRCYDRPIAEHDYFTTPRDDIFREMATPEELFLMQQKGMEYKGQYFTRDVECDVWGGKYTDEALDLTFYKETYMSTNGWHSDADERIQYGVPIKHSITVNQVDQEFVRTIKENNFFKFKSYPPMLFNFDISECVETMGHTYYAIKLFVPEGEPQTTLLKYRFVFLEAAQYYLATVSDLASPLRIQRITLSVTKSGVFLTFAMIEKPDGILNPKKGASVEDAAKKLRTVVDEGNFEIIYFNPDSETQVPITAEPGNFFDWYPGGNVTVAKKITDKASKMHEKEHYQLIYEHLGGQDTRVFFNDKATETPKKSKDGMSGGALAGLAIGMILIGIAIGIAVMYLYIQKYGTNTTGNEYVMHQSVG